MAELERKPLEWMDEAPIQVSSEREISADAGSIWAILADHETWPQWFGSLSKVEVTGEATGVGAQRRVFVKGLGAFDEVFLAWEPGAAFGFSVTHMSRPVFSALNELITLEVLGEDRVRVTYRQALEPKRWAAPLFKIAAKRNMPKALAKGLDGLAERAEGNFRGDQQG